MKYYLEFKNFISVKHVTLRKENDWEYSSCDCPDYFNRGICFHLIKKKFMSFPEPIYEPKRRGPRKKVERALNKEKKENNEIGGENKNKNVKRRYVRATGSKKVNTEEKKEESRHREHEDRENIFSKKENDRKEKSKDPKRMEKEKEYKFIKKNEFKRGSLEKDKKKENISEKEKKESERKFSEENRRNKEKEQGESEKNRNHKKVFGEENKKKHNDTLKKERYGKINDEDNFTRKKTEILKTRTSFAD